MQTSPSRLRSATACVTPGRAAFGGMLLGITAGAVLACGALASEQASVVTIDNFTFAPSELIVAAGTTVKWVNHDDIPHSVVESDTSFRSRALDTDDSFAHTFAHAGTFSYFCGLHPHMTGKIIVR